MRADELLDSIKFDEKGLVPAIVQDVSSLEVLMFAYMNAEALKLTLSKRLLTFWSRSRCELWTKGETSGNRLHLRELRYDCDIDALLILAELEGTGVCHTGERTCFYRSI